MSAWVVRGEHDEVGLTDNQRNELQRSPNIRLITIADARHFVMTDQPARTAEVILDATGCSQIPDTAADDLNAVADSELQGL